MSKRIRLAAIADMIAAQIAADALLAKRRAEGRIVLADIGTDHAYLPLDLCKKGVISSAIAADVKEGPLRIANAHITEAHLSDRIETRLSDGLSSIHPGEADILAVCGMGGELVLHILQTNPMTAKAARMLILSPHSKAYDTRAALRELRFTIFAEDLVCEDGKYYPVMAVRAADEENETAEHRIPMEGAGGWAALTEAERIELSCRYGYHPLQNRSPILADFLQKEERRLSAIKVRTSGSRRDEVAKELDLLNKALAVMRI